MNENIRKIFDKGKKQTAEQGQQTSRIETIMNNLPGMVYQHLYNFPVCTLTYVSEGSKEYMGYTPEELVGDNNLVDGVNKFMAMIHPDDIDNVGETFIETIEAGLVHEQAYRIITRDGRVKWIRDRCAVLEWGPDGKPVEVQGYMFDITEQKEMEETIHAMQMKEAMAEEEKMKLAITEASPLAYVLRDKNMNPIDCNSEVVRLFSCPDKQAFLDNYWVKLMPETQPDGEKSKEKMQAYEVDSGGRLALEWTYLSYTGEEFPAEITLMSIMYRNQPYLLSFIYDLSNIKRMEKQLEAALLEAHSSSRAKSDFMSRMSHEMRTPMNAIMGMTDVIKTRSLTAFQKECLEDIFNASRNLMQMIDDVLEYSNTEYNILKLEETAFSFEDMFKDILKQFKRFFDEKNQTFDFDIDKSLPVFLVGDKNRLSKAISNLIGNAVKFTPEHGKINFTANVIDAYGKTVSLRLEVTDTGIGISEDNLKNIFRVFEQGDESNTRAHEGIGLGLAFTKRIAEMMGGTVQISSKQGEGTRAVFTCKLKKV